MLRTAVLLFAMATGSAATAGDLVFGLGGSKFSDDNGKNSPMFTLEYHGAAFGSLGRFYFMPAVGASVDGEGGAWVGIGVSTLAPIGSNGWFFEGSFMPGYYHAGDDRNDLGYDLEFRTLLGFGKRINDRNSISLAFDHKSNAHLGDHNPGVNNLSLRWRINL
ncbi:MAG: acyloxyacyl hydrolase [Pseudorhodobacter sp.]